MKCAACPDPAHEPRHVPHDMTCVATRRGFELLAESLNPVRPFPVTHSIPLWFPLHKAATRCPYEGEPRDAMKLLEVPEPQYWGPRWLDVIVALWAGPIHLEGRTRNEQRNEAIQTIATLWTSSMKRRIWEEAKGDLRAARDYLTPVIRGPLPKLIDEVEGRA